MRKLVLIKNEFCYSATSGNSSGLTSGSSTSTLRGFLQTLYGCYNSAEKTHVEESD